MRTQRWGKGGRSNPALPGARITARCVLGVVALLPACLRAQQAACAWQGGQSALRRPLDSKQERAAFFRPAIGGGDSNVRVQRASYEASPAGIGRPGHAPGPGPRADWLKSRKMRDARLRALIGPSGYAPDRLPAHDWRQVKRVRETTPVIGWRATALGRRREEGERCLLASSCACAGRGVVTRRGSGWCMRIGRAACSLR